MLNLGRKGSRGTVWKKMYKKPTKLFAQTNRFVFTLPFNILSRRAAATKPTGKYGAKEVNCQLIGSANIG